MLNRLLKRWPVMIRDDRGAPVPLVAPPKLGKHERTGWWRPRYSGPHAGHGADWESQIRAASLYGLCCGLSITGSRPLAEHLLRNSALPGKTYLVMLLTGLLCWPLYPVVMRFVRSARRGELRSAYIASRHCPSCDYDISRTAVGDSAITTCPECGAAWKLT
ncbi:MAG TPA: hypothetical protein VFF65_00400 [Phycisphaerales bacterium]|nr:hypothetical protein [Phycisphaerales bacterium]